MSRKMHAFETASKNDPSAQKTFWNYFKEKISPWTRVEGRVLLGRKTNLHWLRPALGTKHKSTHTLYQARGTNKSTHSTRYTKLSVPNIKAHTHSTKLSVPNIKAPRLYQALGTKHKSTHTLYYILGINHVLTMLAFGTKLLIQIGRIKLLVHAVLHIS